MAVSREWEAFVLGQLSGLGRVRAKRMFGGVGLSLEETFWGRDAVAAARRSAAAKRQRTTRPKPR